MGRPREFDRQEALGAAMRVFWARGFEGTSLCDLIEAMGISKSSFYETFGSKHDIFLASLDHYRDNVIGLLSLKLETAKSPRAAIVATLRQCRTAHLASPWSPAASLSPVQALQRSQVWREAQRRGRALRRSTRSCHRSLC